MRYALGAFALVVFLIALELCSGIYRFYRKKRFPDEKPKTIDWASVRARAHLHCPRAGLHYNE